MNDETKLFGGIILATLVIVGVAVFFLSQPVAPPKPVDEKLLIRDDSPRTSTASAAISLVEFGDYQCPACGAYSPFVKKILENFKDSVTFVFREYPLSIHPNAAITSQAAVAAGKQGKYWEMHDMLYEKQAQWSESGTAKELLLGYAKDIGLDVPQFAKDLESAEVKEAVQAGIRDGNALGINATPTFYLDRLKITNPTNYVEFETLVKQALANAQKSATTSSSR